METCKIIILVVMVMTAYSATPKYKFPKNESCEMVTMDATFVLDYSYNDTKHDKKTIHIPETVTSIHGECDNDTDNHYIEIVFDDDSLQLNFTFHDGKLYTELIYTLNPSKRFNDSDLPVKLELLSPPIDLLVKNNTGHSYYCEAAQDVLLHGNDTEKGDEQTATITFTSSNVQIQAFGLENETFGEKDECAADKKTTVMPSTTPKPTGPPDENYTVWENGHACISMSTELMIAVTYLKKDDKNATVWIPVVGGRAENGTCGDGDDAQTLDICWGNEFCITFTFNKTDIADDGKTFFVVLEDVMLQFDFSNATLFPDAKNPDANATAHVNYAAKSQMWYTENTQYYKCSHNETIETTYLYNKVNYAVDIYTTELRMMAYFTKNNTAPNLDGDNYNECADDMQTNSIVPIAVGAALAGLVIIVLIAYLIGRKRTHRGYESV